MDFDRLAINTVNRDAGTFVKQHVSGIEWEGGEVGTVRPLEGTMVGWVAKIGQPHLREEIGAGDSFPSDEPLLAAGLGSCIGLPLFNKGLVVGTLAVHSQRVDAYGQLEQDTLERMADQIAPAVGNARLYVELQLAHDDLESRVETRTMELIRAEERLVQAQKMEVVGQLAGGVAHDFNNLLTPILGFSTLGMDELAPDHPVHGYLQQVQQSAERGAELVRQLLGFARRQVVQPRVLNLNDHVINTEKMLRA